MINPVNLCLYFKIIFINLILITNLISQELHQDLLKKLDNNFPAEISFIQTDSNNFTSKGWMIVGKNGLARVEFEPPNHYIMVADGSWLVVHDAQYDRTSYLPLDKGILGALLHPKKFNSVNKLRVSKIENKNNINFAVASENFEGSELKVYFNRSNELLNGWEIIENKKLNIKVEILEIKKINNLMKFDENIFKFSEFMRANIRGFFGPYERKLKKIPKSKPN